MRNGFSLLVLAAAVIFGFFFLLPILGVLLVGVVVLLLVGLALFWAAPFLAKLPWFRDRIHVNRSRGQWFVHFGGQGKGGPGNPYRADDVIDIEGREIETDQEPGDDRVIGEITDGRKPYQED